MTSIRLNGFGKARQNMKTFRKRLLLPGNTLPVCLVAALALPLALAQPETFTLTKLDPFHYPERDLIGHVGPVKSMLIQVEDYSKNSDITVSAYSANVEINRENTQLKLTYQKADVEYLIASVTPGKNEIVLQEVWQEGGQRHKLESVRRFNSSGCNLSSTDLFWEAPLNQPLPPSSAAPAVKREYQTFCDSKRRPVKLISNVYQGSDKNVPTVELDTWQWNAGGAWVLENGWESVSKRYFDAKGNPVTEIVSVPEERYEIKNVYNYDARGNWVKRTTTVKHGAESAKTLDVDSTETVTREIAYW